MVLKLNLGCENEYLNGWVNLDFNTKVKADIYHDLNKFPWPFKDNSFDIILVANVLEYLWNIEFAMKEIYRISKQDSRIYVSVPHCSNPLKWMELGHKHFFSYMTFGEWHNNKELYPLFQVLKKKIVFTRINFQFMNKIMNNFINAVPRFYERMFSGIIPSSDIVYILRVRKDKEFQVKKLDFIKKMEKLHPIDNLKFIREI